MADGYVDVTALGVEYQAYADTPTSWGVPQDGNGKAASASSAAVPLAEVTFAAVPTSGTISVYGVSITLTGVLSAASTDAAATALASSINATTTATAAGVSALLLPINRVVYARVKPGGGANNSIVQIMCRFAASDLNYASGANTNARVVNTFNNSAMTSPVDFAGGVDGPWAYLLNTTTVFGKSDGQTGTGGPGYGLFFAASPTPFDPGVSDVVHVRTKRSGSSPTITWNSTGTASATWKQRNYVFDDGTVWSGDNGKLTVVFKNSNGSSVGSQFTLGASAQLSFASRGNGNGEFQLGVTASGNGSFYLVSASGNLSKFAFKRCRLVETSDNIRSIFLATDGGSSWASWSVDLSDSFAQLRTAVTSKSIVSANAGSTGMRLVLNGFTLEVASAGANIGKFISLTGATQSGTVEWIGGEVRDSLGVYRCPMPFDIHPGSSLDTIIDGVVGVTNPSVGMTASATVNARFRWVSPEGPNKGFRSETPRAVIDWQGDGTFPYCGSAADLRGVSWAHRFTWGSIPSAWSPVMVARIPRFYRSASASKTIKLFLYLPTATTVYLDELEMTISYLDSTDVWRTESVGGARGLQFAASRTALSASSASWTANSASGYSAKEIAITTAYSIKQNSEFVLRLALCASRGSSLTGYYSPEPGIS